MIKKLVPYIAVVVLAFLLFPIVIYASYSYYIPITISNNSTSVYSNLPILVSINSSQLASLGYIDADGLDTDMVEGSTSTSYMNSDTYVPLYLSSLLASQSKTVNYRLNNAPLQTSTAIVTGYGGYINVTDSVSMELGTTGEVETNGYVDTSAGSNKYLINKTGAFYNYVSAAGTVKAEVVGAGSVIINATAIPDGAGALTELKIFGSTVNLAAVNKTVADDNIYLWEDNGIHTDYYTLDESNIPPGAKVNSISVYCRFYNEDDHAGNSTVWIPYLRLGASTQAGVGHFSHGWDNHNEVIARPGGGSWTAYDLQVLQVGVRLEVTGSQLGKCSLLYVVVNYTEPLSVSASVPSGVHTIITSVHDDLLEMFVDNPSLLLNGSFEVEN